MKSKTSCFNKTIFLKNMTRFWPIWLGYTIYLLLSVAGRLYRNFQYSVRESAYTAEEAVASKEYYLTYIVEMTSRPLIIFAVSVLVAVAVFSYLYTARSANMMHALPVTRKELYFTNYVSGLMMLLVPEVLTFLAGVLVCTMYQVTSLEYMLLWILFVTGQSIFYFSFTVFVGMFTGNLIAVPALTVIANYLFIGMRMLLAEVQGFLVYGYSGGIENQSIDMLSPLYYLRENVHARYDYSGSVTTCKGFIGGEVIGIYAVAGIVFAILAYFIYKTRRLEKTGDLICIDILKPVFRWCASWCVAFVGADLLGQVLSINDTVQVNVVWLTIGMVLCSAVAFFAIQMLLEKNFRVFQIKRIAEWCVTGLLLVGLVAAIEGDAFGMEKKIPDLEEIQGVNYNLCYSVIAEDAQSIGDIAAIHQQVIDSKEEFEAYKKNSANEGMGYFWITYYLKDGSKVERSYDIPKSPEYIENPDSVYERIMELCSGEEAYLQSNIGMNYEDGTLQGGSIDLYTENNNYEYVKIDTESIKTIFEAFRMDIREGNLRSMYDLDGDAYREIVYYNSLEFEFYIKGGFINTYSYFSDSDDGWESNTSESSNSVGISFTKDCVNVVQALIDTGVIESESDLVTVAGKAQQEL